MIRLDNETQRINLIACVRQMAAAQPGDASDESAARHATLAALRRDLEAAVVGPIEASAQGGGEARVVAIHTDPPREAGQPMVYDALSSGVHGKEEARG